MGRRHRPYFPEAVFHVTARTQGHEPWFGVDLRPGIVKIIGAAFFQSDTTLLAYAVMPNHLHLVVRHGRDPLASVLQPLLRRVALRVQRRHDVEGHVFERRYRDHACLDPSYVRNAIVYTHLNPVRAELCREPEQYAWSSHTSYAHGASAERTIVAPDTVRALLGIFATRVGQSMSQLRAGYRRYVAWRRELDVLEAAAPGDPDPAASHRPHTAAGDAYWYRHFRPGKLGPKRTANGLSGDARALADPRARSKTGVRPAEARKDLRDLAIQVVREFDPNLELESVRGRYGGARIVEIRRAIIRRAALVGYRGTEIARFLRVSPATVSRTLSAVRRFSPVASS